MSLPPRDAPRPFQPPVAERDLETEVIHCVGGVASPLLANVALSALDEHFCAKWDAHGTGWRRSAHRKRGGATYRIVRYADFVIMVNGSKAHAETLREEVSQVIAPLGLRLAEAKTRVCHIDEGFDFLGYADAPAMPCWARGPSLKQQHSFPARHNRALLRAG